MDLTVRIERFSRQVSVINMCVFALEKLARCDDTATYDGIFSAHFCEFCDSNGFNF